jgi:hypothetical protein
MTKLNKETIKRTNTIYAEHRKKSGLNINAAKTEVYVVLKVHNITTELRMKDTKKQFIRYLGHKFRPLVTSNKGKLTAAPRTINWMITKFKRSQNVTLQGRIINSNALINTPTQFMLHGIQLRTEDKKIMNNTQNKINNYIKPCTNGDSRYRPIAKLGGGSISVEDMYTSIRMYYLNQLYRNTGQHYRRISHYIGISRIELNYITNTGEYTWIKMEKIMKHVNLRFWENIFNTIRKTIENPLDLHIMDVEIPVSKQQPTKINKIMMPCTNIIIQNLKWQEKSWEIRKLANVLQWHKNDPHTHNKEGEEVLPEACNFRKINEEICIASIEQLKLRQITLSEEEYKQLVNDIKSTLVRAECVCCPWLLV